MASEADSNRPCDHQKFQQNHKRHKEFKESQHNKLNKLKKHKERLDNKLNHNKDNTLLGGDLMHMRCVAHILNLIVSDGLKEIDLYVSRIKAACKFARSSPSRLATFKRCAYEVSITSEASICLDVSTR